MNLDLVFKRLLLLDFLIITLILLSAVFIPESSTVANFNSNMSEISNIVYIFVLIWLVIFYLSIYLMYKFKPLGKQLYLVSFLLACLLNILMGPIAMDEWVYLADTFSSVLAGAILILLYFSPLKKRFSK